MTGWNHGKTHATSLVGALWADHRWGRSWVTTQAYYNYASATDDDLLRWSGEGDRHAFDQVVARHGAFALRVATRLVTDAMVAEDLVQDAFVKAWAQAGRFDGSRARFTTWLYRVIINLSIDHRRRRRVEPLPDDFDIEDMTPGAEDMIDQAEMRSALIHALESLPVRQRAAISLVYDEGMSGAEVARTMGLSAKAVERLLARGREFLRACLVPGKG